MSGQVFYIVNSDKEREALHHSSHIDLENILTLDEADDIPEKIKLNANLNSMFVIISDNTSNSIRDGAALRERFDGRAIAFQISVHTIKKTLGDGKTVSDLCRVYSIPGRLQIAVDEAVETARRGTHCESPTSSPQSTTILDDVKMTEITCFSWWIKGKICYNTKLRSKSIVILITYSYKMKLSSISLFLFALFYSCHFLEKLRRTSGERRGNVV